MKDVLPPAVSKWQFVEEKVRAVLESFAFREVRSAGTLDRAYVAHARWEHEPATRWYRLDRAGDRPRIEAALFGARPPTGDAELVAMTVGLLAEVGIPGGRRVLTIGADEGTRSLLHALKVAHVPVPVTLTAPMSFEVHAGSQRLAAGARNDELVAALGGPPVPALVLELELEALVAALDEPDESFEPPLVAFFACDGARALTWALQAAHRLRLDGVRADISHDEAPLEEQRVRATALGTRLTIVVQDEDLHAGQVLVEDHGTDRRELVAVDDLESTIRQRVD
jgi:anticodon tRNA-binding protein